MTEHECDFPDTCPVCLGPAPKPTVTVERYFDARFDGQCPECDLPIHVGQNVALLSTGRYVHAGCT